MKTANIEIIEQWLMTCPHCGYQEDALFNDANPMQPMVVKCVACGEEYFLTYERGGE